MNSLRQENATLKAEIAESKRLSTATTSPTAPTATDKKLAEIRAIAFRWQGKTDGKTDQPRWKNVGALLGELQTVLRKHPL